MARNKLLSAADLPLEVVILLIAALLLLITGLLLFPVSAGALPYYENGFYGLLLFVFALQTITLGKTPLGDLRASKPLTAAGIAIAAVGIVTCFIPGIFGRLPRILLFICFGPGGFLLLLQMCLARDKLRLWLKLGGIYRRLLFGCGAVYVLAMLSGLLIWRPSLLTTPLAAAVLLVYGAAVAHLAMVLRTIYRVHPEAGEKQPGEVCLPVDRAMLVLTAIFMLLLGVLLIPVNLGLLSFSGSAQLGLLMVLFALQMLASGNTPLGPLPRSWLMIYLGLLFAALGIVSCIIPDILAAPLTILVGALNILGGVIALAKAYIPLLKTGKPRGRVPAVLARLAGAQLTMNLLAILFGLSMLFAGLIPGLAIGAILAANGCVLFYLLHILAGIAKQAPAQAS